MKSHLLTALQPAELKTYQDSFFYNNHVLSSYQYTDYSLKYYSEYFGQEYVNQTILVYNKLNEPVLALYAYSQKEIFTHFGSPVQVIECHFSTESDRFEAYKALISKLNEQLKQNNAAKILFYENEFLIAEYYKDLDKISTDFISLVNLKLTEPEIKSNLRKRYKSFVNWGEKNLKIELIDSNNTNYDKFIAFRNFHIETSGRQTRSNQSWDLQFEAIKNDECFLVLGNYNDAMVSGVLIMYGKKSAYYGVGVNNRKLMEQNLAISHYIMFYGILEAKKRGLEKFIVGYVSNEEKSEKELSIFKYKSGFTNIISTRNIFTTHLIN
jgi:hypothetical protein